MGSDSDELPSEEELEEVRRQKLGCWAVDHGVLWALLSSVHQQGCIGEVSSTCTAAADTWARPA